MSLLSDLTQFSYWKLFYDYLLRRYRLPDRAGLDLLAVAPLLILHTGGRSWLVVRGFTLATLLRWKHESAVPHRRLAVKGSQDLRGAASQGLAASPGSSGWHPAQALPMARQGGQLAGPWVLGRSIQLLCGLWDEHT